MSIKVPESLTTIPYSTIRETLDRPDLDYKDSLPGVEMIERGGINSTGYDCSAHVFASKQWFKGMARLLLFDPTTLEILEDVGYESVSTATEGDVAVYLTHQESLKRYVPLHYGRVVINGLIESKFGENNGVFRHEAFHVPEIYGEHILFLRESITE